MDANPPPLFYLWRMGSSQYAPLGVALMPVWANQSIAYNGTLEDGSTIPGMWDPVDKMPSFPTGFFARGEMPPFVDQWPDGWAPWDHRPMGAAQPTGLQEAPAGQRRAASGPGQGEESEQLPFGPKQDQTVRWEEIVGMAWIRPDPADTHGSPLWSATPGVPSSRWGPLRPAPGRNPDFVNKLQDYGPLQVQRFLDIDWAKVVHTVTKEIFAQEGEEGALLPRPCPITPIGYGQARESSSSRMEGCPRAGERKPSDQRWRTTSLRRSLRQSKHLWGQRPL